MKKKIVITGEKVHGVGYRAFLLAAAESFKIKKFFADNFFLKDKQGVYILIDAEKEKVNAFIQHLSKSYPEKAEVENIREEEYAGNIIEIEAYYRYLNASQLSKIANYGGEMLGKQDSMLGKQDSMLEKQDKTIEILKSVKEDTSLLPSIKEDTSILLSIKEDTSAIKKNTESMPEMFSKILNEIERIKTALIKAGIEI